MFCGFVYVVLYIVFSYAPLYVHIIFLVSACQSAGCTCVYVVSDPYVCPNYYVFPLPYPSPPTAITLGAISFNVVQEQVGLKGQQVKYAKQMRVSQ